MVDNAANYTLSNAQLRMWFGMELSGDPTAGLMPFLLRIRGALSPDALESAVRRLAQRHEVLRARFRRISGQPRMIIAEPADDLFSVADLSPGEDPVAAAEAEGCRPLDLAVDAPFRAVLYPIAQDDHLLLLAIHHLVTDGVSMNVLFDELGVLYAAQVAGAAPALPPARRYVDVSAPSDETLRASAEFWRLELSGARGGIDWPAAAAKPRDALEIGYLETSLPDDLVTALRRAAATLSVTPYEFLLTAFRLLLRHYVRQEEVLVGAPCAGRSGEASERIVGLFVNTLPLRIRVGSEETGASVASRVSAALRAARA